MSWRAQAVQTGRAATAELAAGLIGATPRGPSLALQPPAAVPSPELLAQAVRALGWDAPASELTQHATLIAAVCASPNAKAALAAHRELLRLELPREVHTSLVLGVARPRTASPLGQRGVLTGAQAVRAGEAFTRAPAELRAMVEQLLERAGTPPGPQTDAACERALLLKALAARQGSSRLAEDLTSFAAAIRAVPRYALVTCTTLLDVDDTRRTSRVHTNGLTNTHPLTTPKPKVRDDGDGLLQLYESSCGPASVETLRGESDPIYAWTVHLAGGPQAVVRGGVSDDFQRAWLAHFGEAPRRRRGMYDYLRVAELSKELVRGGLLTRTEHLSLLRYCRSARHDLTARAGTALDKLRVTFGFPSDEELARMRSSFPAATTHGTDDKQLGSMIAEVLTPLSGAKYRFVNRVADGLRAGDMELVARALELVPGIVLGTTDHWWALLEARPGPEGYELLIHDPWTGITALVPERELLDGSFQRTRFGWPRKGRVDSFYVAERG